MVPFPILLTLITVLDSMYECIATSVEDCIMLLWLLQTEQAQLL